MLDKPVPIGMALIVIGLPADVFEGVFWQQDCLLPGRIVSTYFFVGEFDPGSGRTLAACLTHASRAERPFGVLERRTGE